MILRSPKSATILSTLGHRTTTGRRWRQATLSMVATVLAGTAAASVAHAAPEKRASIDQRGDFVLFGNTLTRDCDPATPAPIVGTASCAGVTNRADEPELYWRADAPAGGQAQASSAVTPAQARSTSMLVLPAGATVTHAYLYWSLSRTENPVASSPDVAATLDRPGTPFTAAISGARIVKTYNDQAHNRGTMTVADVTSLVQENGAGAYRLSDVAGLDIRANASNTQDYFAGWWMVVFYKDDTQPLRNLTLFDSLDWVQNGSPQVVNLSGFLVPNSGFNAKLGVVAMEGDSSTDGDRLFFNPTNPNNPNASQQLSNGLNPANNFFNGTRSTLGVGAHNAGDLPELPGTALSLSNMDMDVVDITSKLAGGQTTATVRADTTNETYFLNTFVTSISTQKPDFTSSTKTVVDLNGGSILPGDVLEYTIAVTNKGDDTALGTTVTDKLPAGVTYVADSIEIVSGDNAGKKTDAAGDDQGTYNPGTRTVTVRIGAGANATTGGTLAVGASATIKLQVKVDLDAAGTIENQAIINASGQLGAPATDTPTDGNGPTDGAPPTPVVIDKCETSAQCAAPTPFCDVSASPKVCVGCLDSTACAGATPVCDPVTKTCIVCTDNAQCPGGVCLASGSCDADDDGDGVSNTIDNCPTVSNADQKDTDTDKLGDACDDDDDGDGVTDVDEGTAGTDPLKADTDGDGLTDGQEVTLKTNPLIADTDGDGLLDGIEAPGASPVDTDTDGTIDALDPDDDNDTIPTKTEADLTASSSSSTDVDKDSSVNWLDTDADGDGKLDKDEGTGDLDNDGIPNFLDPDDANAPPDDDKDGLTNDQEKDLGTDPTNPDSDADGVTDGAEAPGGVGVDTDTDGLIDALDDDDDNDTIKTKDELDLATKSGVGADVDSDGKSNWLDTDADGDGKNDSVELTGDTDGDSIPEFLDPDDADGPDADFDKDGLTNSLEVSLGTNPLQADSDGDGIDDKTETDNGQAIDTDKDGTLDARDTDSDGDTILDAAEGTADTDKDGSGDWRDPDDDNDTIPTKDEVELAGKASAGDDVDGDGSKNWLDTNADGDSRDDAVELTGDDDSDGIPNFLDADDTGSPGAGGASGAAGAAGASGAAGSSVAGGASGQGGAAGSSAGGAAGTAGSSAGGAAGSSAGGTSAGGAAGTSAGGTSAGGTSAGGTSAGGTSAGGTSAGGASGAETVAGLELEGEGLCSTSPGPVSTSGGWWLGLLGLLGLRRRRSNG